MVSLRSSCSHVTDRWAVRFVRLVVKVVMKNNRDFVDVILIFVWVCVCSKSHGLLVYHEAFCTSPIGKYLLGVEFLMAEDIYTPANFYLIVFVA